MSEEKKEQRETKDAPDIQIIVSKKIETEQDAVDIVRFIKALAEELIAEDKESSDESK